MDTLTLRVVNIVRTFIRLQITCSTQHSNVTDLNRSLTQNRSPDSIKQVHRYTFTTSTLRDQKIFDIRDDIIKVKVKVKQSH
jgi:hypothetical protein